MKKYLFIFILSPIFCFAGGGPSYPTAGETCVTPSALTPNSACAGWSTAGSNTTGDPVPSCKSPQTQTVWFSFTATSTDMVYTIDNQTAKCTSTSAVYSGGCGSLTEISCTYMTSVLTSIPLNGLTVGQTYYIAVSYLTGGPCGSFMDFCIDICDAEPNDECVNATPIDATPQASTNACASANPTDPPPAELCAISLENTVWYTFTVQNNGDVVITIDNITCVGGGSGFQIGFFSGTCGSLTNDGCSSGSGGTVTATYTGLTAGDQLYIAIDGNAGADCDFDISATNTVPLPIELTRFSASQVNNELLVSLDWITESEINNDYFTVERSKDGINYEVVDIVEGAGNSSSTKTYRTYDNKPFNGDNYYRLKQTDYDGTTTYKGIAHVYINAVSEFDFYPNPANNNINFTFNVNNDNAVTIELYDLTGRIVKNKSYTTLKGLNNKSLDVSDLPSGIYMLKAVVNNNQYIQKIVVN